MNSKVCKLNRNKAEEYISPFGLIKRHEFEIGMQALQM